MAAKLEDILKDIASLIESHQDYDAVRALQVKMHEYEAKFSRTVKDITTKHGKLGSIWDRVIEAADNNIEAADHK